MGKDDPRIAVLAAVIEQVTGVESAHARAYALYRAYVRAPLDSEQRAAIDAAYVLLFE
jgi:hypothetical protein